MDKLIKEAEQRVESIFSQIDETEYYNAQKVLKAFRDNQISEAHFVPTTGYGYDDLGRETIDKVYAQIFDTEDALVRHNIISGTHAISLCMFANLRPGDLVLSVTGKPYDTLEEAIGIRGNESGSLKEFGIRYNQVNLKEDASPDYENIAIALKEKPALVLIQRSKGYEWRKSLDIECLKQLISFIKDRCDTAVLVDNCYGEFVEKVEPTSVGADMIAGSLIKNPGGGIATTGGYIAGKSKYVERVANRLTCPGIGKECGASLGFSRSFFQGIFMAPHVVACALKTAILSSSIFEGLGYEVCPTPFEKRTDIIQAIKFGDKERLITFCQGIQMGSPVDSHVVPQPWDMPGYAHEVIMAAGAFVQGSSIELSADAPIKEPFIAFQQGGLTYSYGKIGLKYALENLNSKNILKKG